MPGRHADFWAKENTNFKDRVKALTQSAMANGEAGEPCRSR